MKRLKKTLNENKSNNDIGHDKPRTSKGTKKQKKDKGRLKEIKGNIRVE